LSAGNAEGAGLPAGRQVSPADKSQKNTSPGDAESKQRLYALLKAISTQQVRFGRMSQIFVKSRSEAQGYPFQGAKLLQLWNVAYDHFLCAKLVASI